MISHFRDPGFDSELSDLSDESDDKDFVIEPQNDM